MCSTVPPVNGMKCLRVISQAKPITRDLRQAERTVNTAVLSAHAQQTSAALASAGDYVVRVRGSLCGVSVRVCGGRGGVRC